jgi:hypothetical protein
MKSDPGFAVPRYWSKGIRTASPICGFWRLRKTRSFNRVHRAKADYRIDLKAIRRQILAENGRTSNPRFSNGKKAKEDRRFESPPLQQRVTTKPPVRFAIALLS